MLYLWKTIQCFVIIQKDRAYLATLRCKKTEMLPHCAFDVRVFLRWTQVLLPLPLPHGFQVIGIEGGDPSACWHLLHHRASPEVQKTDPSHHIYSGIWYTLNITGAIDINPITTCDLLNVVKTSFRNMREAAVTCQCLVLCAAPLSKSSELWHRGSVVPARPEHQVSPTQTALTPQLHPWLRWLALPHLTHKAKIRRNLN